MGFSLIGAMVVACLLLPNLLYFFLWSKPRGPGSPPEATPSPALPPTAGGRLLPLLEQLGRLGCLLLTLFSGDRFLLADFGIWPVLMLLAVALYMSLWFRFLVRGRQEAWLYRPLGPLPVPMAVLPVCTFLFAALWGRLLPLAIAALALGLGHIPGALGRWRSFQ